MPKGVEQRLVMMGTGGFAEPVFVALLESSRQVVCLVTQPDRVIGAQRGSTRQVGRGLKEIALERRIPVFQVENINTAEGVAVLRAFKPDLLVVAAYGQILSRDVLAIPPKGGINVHASLLPKYRGAAPIAWAIYHGETRTGVTIIKMSVHLDAGDILAQEAIDIGPEETAGELEGRLAPLGAKLALQVIDQIKAGTVQGKPQDKSQATKAPKLTKEHGLIDWSRPSRDVYNQIRAMHPWPTAYTFLHREGQPPLRIIVHQASWYKGNDHGVSVPGQIIARPDHDNELHVACGPEERHHGWLSEVEIRELQPAGKRRMGAAEFMRGYHPQAGDYFGPETA